MHLSELLFELSYPKNIGMMEMVKFYELASPEQKLKLKSYIALKNFKAAWQLLQDVTGVKLQ